MVYKISCIQGQLYIGKLANRERLNTRREEYTSAIKTGNVDTEMPNRYGKLDIF